MKKRSILIFLCILPAIGLVCFGLYFFQEAHKSLFLSVGLLCCSLSFFISCIYQRNQRKKKP